MNKAETIQKVREVLGVDPQPEDKHGLVCFEKNGVLLCHVSCYTEPETGVEHATLHTAHSGTNPNYFDWSKLRDRLKPQLDVATKLDTLVVPEGSLKLTKFEYAPGGKWECGTLDLEADTPLGKLVWAEVVPGPRHGEDSAELTVTLNGKELDLYDGVLSVLDFEPPNKEGRWAEEFRNSEDTVATSLRDWYEENKRALAALVS